MVLGMSWLTKAKAKIDTDAQKMTFVSHGRRFSVPLDIRQGVLLRIVEIPEEAAEDKEDQEEDHVAYINTAEEANIVISENRVNPAYRHLTLVEKNLLIEWTMRNVRCPFCDQRVYCAEQMCNCMDTKLIQQHESIGDHLPKERRIKTPRLPEVRRQYCPVMPAGPYNGNNPHPYCDNTGEVYDCFWENVGYIGKKHFRGNRNVYAEGCYWSDVNPEDLWEVKKRCDKDDGNYDYKYHSTWKEQEDQDQEYREWQEQNPPQEGMYEAYTVYEE